MKQPSGSVQMVSCGHCLNCSIRRQMGWTLRMCLEQSEHAFSNFTTLTYAEDVRPEKLEYEHIQTFLKRLRKSLKNGVRFFCCGEYGPKSGHPHWHLILFGPIALSTGLCHIKQWPYGHAFIGHATPQSMSYVARYALKSGVNGDKYKVTMSRRPGLGFSKIRSIASYLATKRCELDYTPAWLRHGTRLYPLDRNARSCFETAYVESGGSVKTLSREPAAYELEAMLVALVGDPLSEPSRFSLRNLDRRTIENAKI